MAGLGAEVGKIYLSLEGEAKDRFGRAFGGDETVRPAFAHARTEPSPESLGVVGRLLEYSIGHPSARTLREVLEFAIEKSASDDPALRKAAIDLLQATVWPLNRYVVDSSTSSTSYPFRTAGPR